jgi:hypothetical protein
MYRLHTDGEDSKMSWCCCFKRRRGEMVYSQPWHSEGETAQRADFKRDPTPDDERKNREKTPTTTLDEIDLNVFNFVKKKLRRHLPENTSYEYICSQAKKYLSHTIMEHYFSYMLDEASQVILETTDELETSLTNTYEKAMLQRRTLQRFETVTDFPVKLILSDLQVALPPFASSFARILQMEFGPLHAALIIDNVLVEWNDHALILPTVAEKEWVFQARLQSNYDKFTKALGPEMRDSIRKLDLKKQIEQVFEVSKEKQQAIHQLIQVIIHYNETYDYNVLTRNCQHFVIDAMKALGVKEVPQFTGVFQEYFEDLKQGKSKDILEKFESHAALDEHVDTIMKPGLTQHDMEYLLCQYFMFHVFSRKQSPNAQDPDWSCEQEGCRMSDVEEMLERDTGLLLIRTFSQNCN